MNKITFISLLLFVLFHIDTEAQTRKDSVKLRMAIDSIRDGRDLKKDRKGNIDTGSLMKDTINTKPEIPTPPTPNNPNPHDPQPSPVHPNPPIQRDEEPESTVLGRR